MPVDPFAVLQALLRAEASRAQRSERRAPEPTAPKAEPAPAPEPPAYRDEPLR
ncbi:hypothetical protein [Streptomyces sp. NBC_00691]|uniref:hypothetical protein n=1 Tax=Streptomyces sp. NBC_00691 TaxID=2903671 RepID=UPI002E36CB66|nr:hypothetical protein [Streptomyces sp. NBC_00691]